MQLLSALINNVVAVSEIVIISLISVVVIIRNGRKREPVTE